ncbi:Fe-S cluster assembly protein SufD [Paraburkholderia aspalathi]|uniref:Iron-regulated ABC transporter permease protein SufD n=1 Tax=Paraburkholderia aspalathi TaxID=1324617 RepID=A0A1I7EJB0_9BURK|nr:Fe-S cluster assembly protein SufD [Paraburkholderia aspalathi]SFU23996.1 Iron-regulated ABC transporter permease protein SufD [Paraburkholderia aspalathi]
MKDESLDHFHHAFRQFSSILPGAELPWLRAARRNAIDQFGVLGLPTTRQEDWKYTNVSAIGKCSWHFAPQHTDLASRFDESGVRRIVDELALDTTGHRLVFVNGRHVSRLSRLNGLPQGVFVGSLTRALREMPQRLEALIASRTHADGFAALNTAFLTDGFVVMLPPGAVIDQPLHMLFLNDEPGLAVQPFNAVLAGARSGCAIVEQFVGLGDDRYWTNTVTHIVEDEQANVQHYRLQQESAKAFHIASLAAVQERASCFVSHAFAFGGALSRTGIGTSLNAANAQATLTGLYFVGGRQHVDHHTRIDHTQAQGTSREYYRGVLDGAARGVFNGRVIVHPDAQQTDTYQSNHNLLLSRDAEIDTKPQLEIYADDVKCTHGATVGQLDDDQLFYLRARGVEEHMARALLTYAFARDIVERVRVDSLRGRLESLLLSRTGEGERIRELL